MAPRADEYEQESFSSTDDDADDGFKEDMAALTRACKIDTAATDDDDDDGDFTAPTAASLDLVLRADDGAQTGSDVRDPLLDDGDAVVPFTSGHSDSDDDRKCLERVVTLYKPLSTLPPLPTKDTTAFEDDEDDDMETLRAILNRFSGYDVDSREGSLGKLAEGDRASSLGYEKDIANGSTSYRSEGGESGPVSQDLNNAIDLLTGNIEMQHCGFGEGYKLDAHNFSKLPPKRSSFPPSAQAFIDAIKKNRSLQRFLRSKLIEMEAKIEENKRLRDKVKLLKDFQASCVRRTGSALSLKKDPRVQLISAKKSQSKKKSAMCLGPADNSHVANYKMVLERFPPSLDRKKWSNVERENLMKGIKQQFQEMVLQISVDRISSECSFGDANDMDGIIASINHLEITPERIREFLPKVNWDQLASMYVPGHTGAECESRISPPGIADIYDDQHHRQITIRVQVQHRSCRWLNCEDPLINRDPWISEEDRSLLLIVQDMGIRNWFNIAVSLATNRTPFQCLARFQRSLNPSMLNSEWTEEEDAQLCSAVAFFGESNWQAVASVLERRAGTQCSNRWKKSICPGRKGTFTPEEDKRLTVAVMLFGRKWNQIAKFVPGRIQSQCRDRYLNSLDPSLKWGGWTEEEDSRLEAAVAKHGYCWSKVAEDMPPRTDSQCRKRYRVLFPDQVLSLQIARKRQKSLLGCNFVDRESERPALTLKDFLPLPTLGPPSADGDMNLPVQRKRKSSVVHKKKKSKRPAKKAHIHPEEVEDIESSDDANTCGGDVPLVGWSTVPKRMRSKRYTRKARLYSKEVEDTVGSDEVMTTNGEYTKDNSDDCTINRYRTWKLHCGQKLYAKDSMKHCNSQDSFRKSFVVDGEVVGSNLSRGVSKKGSNNSGKVSRKIRGTKKSNQLKTKVSKPGSLSTCVESLEIQEDGDDITLASFLNKKSKKKGLKCSKNASQDSFSSRTAVISKQVDKQNPSGEPDGLSQSSGTSGTKDLFIEQNVASPGQVRKPEDVNALTGGDDDDNMTLVRFMGNKSKKRSQAAKAPHAGSSSKLKKGSVSVPEVHGASKPTIVVDDNGPSMSKLIEMRSDSSGGLAVPTNFNVDEENELLPSFLKNTDRRQRKQNKAKETV